MPILLRTFRKSVILKNHNFEQLLKKRADLKEILKIFIKF